MGEDGVSESEFTMWRAVFAFSLVDNVLSMQEQEMLRSYKSQVPFSKGQIETLNADFKNRQDVEKLYDRITDTGDKKRFCVLARALVWSDGDMDMQETEILKKVSCLKTAEGQSILNGTRGHPHGELYYNQYAKAGVVGLLDMPHILEMRI